MKRLVFAAVWGVALAQPPSIREEYRKAAAGVELLGGAINNTAGSIAALHRMWSLIGEWVVQTPNVRPASGGAIEAAVRGLDDKLGCRAIELENGAFVVSVAYGFAGTFFIVDKGPFGFRVAWTIVEFASRLPDRKRGLASWAPPPGAHPLDRLSGFVEKLPPTAAGNGRFFVNADYASFGGSWGSHLSIWEWNGREATLLVQGGYGQSAQTPPRSFDGETLRISTIENMKRLFSCRACRDPVGDWTIRVTPDGIVESRRLREPELAAIDELFDRLMRNQPASDLASAAAIARLQLALRETDGLIGMFGNVAAKRTGASSRICFDTDELGRLVFDLTSRRGTHYVTDVTDATDMQSCAVALGTAR